VVIATYIVPFSWGSVGQTQAQPSLYERLHDRVNEIEEIIDKELDDLKDRFDGNQRSQDRIDDAQDRTNERFDEARDKVNNAFENGDHDEIEPNSINDEVDDLEPLIQSLQHIENEESESNRIDENRKSQEQKSADEVREEEEQESN
jgi:hypothetical protein